MRGRYALYSPTLLRIFATASLCGVLAGCAGVPKEPVVHNNGICMHIERESADLLGMKVCNCSGRLVRLEVNDMPWDPLARAGFRMAFNGEPVPTREIGLVDPTPFSFYQIPDGECLDGQIHLADTFAINGRDLYARGWNLRWTGTIFGDGESWKLDVGYEF